MKRLIAAISALVIFLGYAFLYESKQETKQEKPTVAILQLMTHPALDSIHHGIVDALATKETALPTFTPEAMLLPGPMFTKSPTTAS